MLNGNVNNHVRFRVSFRNWIKYSCFVITVMYNFEHRREDSYGSDILRNVGLIENLNNYKSIFFFVLKMLFYLKYKKYRFYILLKV